LCKCLALFWKSFFFSKIPSLWIYLIDQANVRHTSDGQLVGAAPCELTSLRDGVVLLTSRAQPKNFLQTFFVLVLSKSIS